MNYMNGHELFQKIKQCTFTKLLESVNSKTKSETQSKKGNLKNTFCEI